MFKNYTWLLIVGVLVVAAFFFYRQREGFQNESNIDPKLAATILVNLSKAYVMASERIKKLGVNKQAEEGSATSELLLNQTNAIQDVVKKCKSGNCTEADIKNPEFIRVYNEIDEIAELGLPEISFESLAIGPPEMPK